MYRLKNKICLNCFVVLFTFDGTTVVFANMLNGDGLSLSVKAICDY